MPTMVARLVPVAMRGEKANQAISNGTITVPPPTPKSPLNAPAAVPMMTSLQRSLTRRVLIAAILEAMSHSTDPDRLEEMIARLGADPARTAILTDIDGTIAPIVDRPEQAGIGPQARKALGAIHERFALVACVSGRRATEARQLVGVEGITYSGNHGMETLEPNTRELQLDLTLRGHGDAAASFVDQLDRDRLAEVGLRLEDKGPIQALHWRGASSEDRARAEAESVAAAVEQAGLEPHWGRKVLEIRPPGGGGKGAAIDSLLAGTGVELAAYAGDDVTDLDAFRRLKEMAREPGPLKAVVCIGIASAEGPDDLADHADLILDGPAGWISVLERLAG